MKYLILVGVVFSVLVTMIARSDTDQSAAEIVKVVKAFERAMIKNDANEIGSFLADDWIVVGPDGATIDKAHFLSLIQSGKLSHEAMDSEDFRLRVYGTTAIVTALTSSKARYMKQELSTRERATDVFIKRDDKWQCVITHLTTFTGK